MMRMQAADEQSVLEWCFQQEHEADVVRAPYLDDQEMLLSFYMNHRQMPLPQGLEWMSGELLADSFLLIESFIPNVGQAVLGGKSVSINAYTLAGTDVNKALDKGLYRMRARAGFEAATMNSLRMAAITGHAFQKNVWVTEWGTKRVPIFSNPRRNAFGEETPARIVDHELRRVKTFDGPRSYYPDNQKVWKSAAVDALGRPLVWGEEVSLNLDYMIDVNREYEAEYGEPFYRNLDQLRFAHKSTLAKSAFGGNAGYVAVGSRRSATEQAAMMGSAVEGESNIRMKHTYACVPLEIRDYGQFGQERLIVYTPDGITLRDVPCPTWNLRSPLRDIKFMQIANEPFGRTPLYWCLPEVEQRSETRNLRLAEAYLNIFMPRIVNRNANWDQHDWGLTPGGVWMYDHDEAQPNQVVATLPRQPYFQEIYHEDALMEDHINRTFGSTPNMQGEGLGSRATKAEAQLVDFRAGGRADLISAQLAWQYEYGAAVDYLGNFAAFSEDPLIVQIDGEEAEFPVEILAEEIDFEYDVEINTGGWGVANAANLQALQMILGSVMANPEIVFDIDPRLAISNYQHQTSMPNILRSRAEAQQMRAAAQQAQMMQLLADKAGPSGGS